MARSKTFQDGQPLSAADVNTHLYMPVPRVGDPIETGRVSIDATPGDGITIVELLGRRVGFVTMLSGRWRGTIAVPPNGDMPNRPILTLPPEWQPVHSSSAVITSTAWGRMVSYDLGYNHVLSLIATVPDATQTTTVNVAMDCTFTAIYFSA